MAAAEASAASRAKRLYKRERVDGRCKRGFLLYKQQRKAVVFIVRWCAISHGLCVCIEYVETIKSRAAESVYIYNIHIDKPGSAGYYLTMAPESFGGSI